MKRILYFSSFIVAFTLSLQFLFKTMYWPGASALLFIGNATLLLFTLPSLVVLGLRNRNLLATMDKVRMSIGVFSGVLISNGMIFKALQWQGAGILFVAGAAIFSLVFLPIFFYQLYQRSVQVA